MSMFRKFAPIDQDKMEKLAFRLMGVLRDHYREEMISRDRVYEIMNALAFVLAVVILPAGDENDKTQALDWFLEAFELNMGNPELLDVLGRVDDMMGGGNDPSWGGR